MYIGLMTKINILKNLTDEQLLEICDIFSSASAYLRTLDIPLNGRHITFLNNRRKDLNLEWQDAPNKIPLKTCPVCSKEFKPTSNRDQTTCSVGCANTYFRSGQNNPNYNPNKNDYRFICFSKREKKCVICGEDKVIEVHHYDQNHDNNEINNLIPLCPNHHRYFHSKYRNLVESQIDEWRNNNLI